MTFDPYADRFRIADPKPLFAPSSASTPPSVKSEPSSDLSPSPHHPFSFAYPVPSAPEHPLPYDSVPQDDSVFRFGMTHPDSWSLKRPQHDPAHASIDLDLGALAFPDDYEDADELSDLPGSAASGPAAHATQAERIIRRRSSKGGPPLRARRHSL